MLRGTTKMTVIKLDGATESKLGSGVPESTSYYIEKAHILRELFVIINPIVRNVCRSEPENFRRDITSDC